MAHPMKLRSEARKLRYADLMQVLADRQIIRALMLPPVRIGNKEYSRKTLLRLLLHGEAVRAS